MQTHGWRPPRPPTSDVLLAAAFAVLGQVVTAAQLEGPASHSGSRPVNAVLNLLLMAGLAWRRRAPLGAVTWATVVYFLPYPFARHDLTFSVAFIPLVVLTASAGYACSRRRAGLALSIAVLATSVVTLTSQELRSPSALLFNLLFLLVPWLGAGALRHREEKAAALGARLATERTARAAALDEAAAAERRHIARELHDIVAHSVSMMVIQIGAARTQLGPGPSPAREPLLDAEEAGRQTLQDLRRLLGVLRTDEPAEPYLSGRPEPPQPGVASIGTLADATRAAGVEVDLEPLPVAVTLPPALDLTIYRIVQEALTNVVKHSHSSRVAVRLTHDRGQLEVEVWDDGEAPGPVTDPGHGLAGIRERVSLFGGWTTAGPAPGGGWRVHAQLPVPGEHAP